MRRRLLVVLLTLICFTGGAVAYGRTQSNNMPLYGFEMCDGYPCFMSLDFRKIPDGSLYGHILSLPVTYMKSEAKARVDIPITNTSYEVTYTSDGSGLIFNTFSKKPTLGEFISFYGEPCGLATSDPIPTIILLYPTMTVTAAFEGQFPFDPLHFRTPIDQVIMWNPDTENTYGYSPCDSVKWRGFASFKNYWDHGLVWSGD